VENQKQVSHFPAYGLGLTRKKKRFAPAVGHPPFRQWRSEGEQQIKTGGRNNCRRQGKVVDAGQHIRG
jgi:hypothetical protein